MDLNGIRTLLQLCLLESLFLRGFGLAVLERVVVLFDPGGLSGCSELFVPRNYMFFGFLSALVDLISVGVVVLEDSSTDTVACQVF